ncbi:MAG TPA: hypothetical protein DCW95_00140 [Chryseobacterium sp.]|nr:hypothetical protein [Chryseobacterium sp.]
MFFSTIKAAKPHIARENYAVSLESKRERVYLRQHSVNQIDIKIIIYICYTKNLYIIFNALLIGLNLT